MNSDFVHLHTHSEYSLLDGMGSINEYLDRVQELGQRGLGIADHGNLFGVYELITEARKRGLKPVPGIEAYMSPMNPEGSKVKHPVFYGKNGKKDPSGYDVSGGGAYTHQTLWAFNNTGLHNLFKLSTYSYQPENFYLKQRIDFDALADNSDGLVIGTGCPSSEISTRLLLGQDEEAYDYAQRLYEIFGKDRMFVEVMDHSMKSDLERLLIPKQLEMAKKFGLRLLATNDAHYTLDSDSIHHSEWLCAQVKAKMSDKTYSEGGRRMAFEGNGYYLKSTEEMAKLFPDDKFPHALESTIDIMDMADDISLDFDDKLMPKPIIPEGFDNEVVYLQDLVNEGFKKRYQHSDAWYSERKEYAKNGFTTAAQVQAEAIKRIKEEFEVIHSSNFIGYFLTVREYLQWTKDKFSTKDDKGNILASSIGPGRGSVGGSVIAYCMGISELCPIRYDLIFERFLTAGRGATYRIEYTDGTFEDILVSDMKTVHGDKKYIHELSIGDVVDVDDSSEQGESNG